MMGSNYILHLPIHATDGDCDKFRMFMDDWDQYAPHIASHYNMKKEVTLHAEDDSWNMWGEPDPSIHAARHLMVELDKFPTHTYVQDLIDMIREYMEMYSNDYAVGDLVVLTTSTDWSMTIGVWHYVVGDTTCYPVNITNS